MRDVVKNLSQKRGYARSINQNKILLAWLYQETKKWGIDLTIPEMVYLVLHDETPFCKNGNRKKFNTLDKGFRFCGSKVECSCNRENQSNKLSNFHSLQSDQQKAAVVDKMRSTCIERYGVENAMMVDDVKCRLRKQNLAKYGVEWHTQAAEVKENTKLNNLIRYGVEWHTQLDEVKEKIKQTCQDRYSSDSAMHIARAAYTEQTGYDNPFSNPVIQQQIRDILVATIGVDHPLKSDVVKAKRIQTYLNRYGRSNWVQGQMSTVAYDILQNKEAFEQLCEVYSISELAVKLEVNDRTIGRYMDRYEIERPGRSGYETAMQRILDNAGINYKKNTQTIIKGELDFYLPDLALAIEMCGLYFHSQWSERGRPNAFYHYDKWRQCNEKGISLLTIFGDEWVLNNDVVRSRIHHLIGHAPRGVGARQLEISKIEWASAAKFLDKHHLQGSGIAVGTIFGAFDDDALVAVMAFSTNPRGEYDYELVRYATNGFHYPGIASKMFKTFVEICCPTTVVSFSDNRHSTGKLYQRLGFILDGNVDPSFYYTDYKRRYHKSILRKERLEKFGINPSEMTESIAAQTLGFDRIWDCGKLRWVWRHS